MHPYRLPDIFSNMPSCGCPSLSSFLLRRNYINISPVNGCSTHCCGPTAFHRISKPIKSNLYLDYMENLIRIAVQKSGRLSDDSLKLIKECGLKFYNGTGKLKSSATNFPMELLYLRDDDIPGYVADGVADLGIVGENEVAEKDKQVDIRKKLGFSKCRLSLAIPKGEKYSGPSYFDGKNVATSYPKILGDYLKKNDIKAAIHEISGSVEIAPGIGLAEGICDIVSSGSTLLMNGLVEVERIFSSEAVLVSNRRLTDEKTA